MFDLILLLFLLRIFDYHFNLLHDSYEGEMVNGNINVGWVIRGVIIELSKATWIVNEKEVHFWCILVVVLFVGLIKAVTIQRYCF